MKKQTEIVEEVGKLHEVIHVEYQRADGSLFVGQDFQNCPTLAEQHSANETDLNYLIARYRPDELAAYIAAKSQHKQEIVGHDFSIEPDLQTGMNITYRLKKAYQGLSDEIKSQFRNHVEFLKFIDNPANQEKMIKLGLMTKTEIAEHVTPVTTPTQETKEPEEPTKQSSKTSKTS